jgi:hypothetical protein
MFFIQKPSSIASSPSTPSSTLASESISSSSSSQHPPPPASSSSSSSPPPPIPNINLFQKQHDKDLPFDFRQVQIIPTADEFQAPCEMIASISDRFKIQHATSTATATATSTVQIQLNSNSVIFVRIGFKL